MNKKRRNVYERSLLRLGVWCGNALELDWRQKIAVYEFAQNVWDDWKHLNEIDDRDFRRLQNRINCFAEKLFRENIKPNFQKLKTVFRSESAKQVIKELEIKFETDEIILSQIVPWMDIGCSEINFSHQTLGAYEGQFAYIMKEKLSMNDESIQAVVTAVPFLFIKTGTKDGNTFYRWLNVLTADLQAELVATTKKYEP